MIEIPELSPGRKALKTARWARIMTKWLITFSGGAKRKWRFVEFGGPTGSESRGIVDILAIRKDHGCEEPGLKRGDCFEIVFIQTKGGSAPHPTEEDLLRLRRLARRYHAKAVVLAEWRKGMHLQLFRLHRTEWRAVTAEEIFGTRTKPNEPVQNNADDAPRNSRTVTAIARSPRRV